MLTPKVIKQVVGGKWLVAPRNENKKLSGAIFDSRKITKEQIFFCWSGVTNDAHNYLADLKNSSIKLVIVEKKVAIKADFAILLVTKSLTALHQLAKFIAQNFTGPIIAITGSSGKTTAKNWLHIILKQKYKILISQKNFNNHIGCPISLLDLRNEELILLEMGTSAKGEIQTLVNLVEPTHSILLNVGLAHIYYFNTPAKIYKEKIAIFNSARLKIGLMPAKLEPPLKKAKLIPFGNNPNYYCRIIEINLKTKKSYCTIKYGKNKQNIWLSIIGVHIEETISMALLVAKKFNLTWQELLTGLKKLKASESRMEIIPLKQNRFLIDDTYNANPNSVINLLKSISLLIGYKKIAVIGTLAELEDNLAISSAYLKNNIPAKIDKIYFTGITGKKLVQKLNKSPKLPEIVFIKDKAELLTAIKEEFTKNCVLALKASRSAKFENLIDKLKQ